jgi:asparagine synthase (glutamine-hydrolysing)
LGKYDGPTAGYTLIYFLLLYTMCGIAGIISLQTNLISVEKLKQMTDVLLHRGPDGEGCWINESGAAGFGHRRLAIIDITNTGKQPMHYLNRYTIIHNGEIYNYIELKDDLIKKGYHFKSQSDTEVVLAAYDFYKEECLQHFDGMFAFAIWDEKEQSLFAARDRFGEKPFYYHFDGTAFSFASEMKALWAIGITKETDNTMLLNYLSLGWVKNPVNLSQTFYKNIFSLPQAHFLKLQLNSKLNTIKSYWNIDKETISSISEKDAVEKFNELFTTSVARRLRSDVKVGTSLSGGLDSSSIIAAISKVKSQKSKVETFSAVFPAFEKDESEYINKIVATYLSINHFVIPAVSDLVNDFEKICFHQEEPFGSSSILAQYKVFELAKQQGVTVLLDGQGADEILAGYPKYIHWYLQELFASKKKDLLKKEKAALRQNEFSFNWGIKNYLAALLPKQAAAQIEKDAAYDVLHNKQLTKEFRKEFYNRQTVYKPIYTELNDALHYNSMQTGLEELLRYADRNSMAHGREVRLPFLNHELVQFIFSLPAQYKINNGWTKWILRETMKNSLPEEILWRKNKTGFETPQKQWMQDAAVQEAIYEAKKKFAASAILKKKEVNKKVQPMAAHDAGNFDWRYLSAAMLL